MFRGNHPARVDEKGRLKVPSEFKAALEAQGRECFITSRDGQRAEIHSLKDWEQVEELLAKLPASGAKKRLLDATNYYGQVVRMDDQGRLLIPQLLRDAASLVGDVAVMGIEKKIGCGERCKAQGSDYGEPGHGRRHRVAGSGWVVSFRSLSGTHEAVADGKTAACTGSFRRESRIPRCAPRWRLRRRNARARRTLRGDCAEARSQGQADRVSIATLKR